MRRSRQVGMKRMIVVNNSQKTVGTVTLLQPKKSARRPRLTSIRGVAIIPKHLPICVRAG